ncbi:MAG: NifB/NifX family molybdenum-iron cluster-binding protein [Candidatus Thorarchaeota archaeon]
MGRILVPVRSQEGILVAEHFGRAPFFAVIELTVEGEVSGKTVHPNAGEHSGGRGHAHDNVLRLGPNAVIVRGMGPRGLNSFQRANVAVLRANSESVDEIISAYTKRELEELTEGCSDAHHK